VAGEQQQVLTLLALLAQKYGTNAWVLVQKDKVAAEQQRSTQFTCFTGTPVQMLTYCSIAAGHLSLPAHGFAAPDKIKVLRVVYLLY
jgi:hypothetical protein